MMLLNVELTMMNLVGELMLELYEIRPFYRERPKGLLRNVDCLFGSVRTADQRRGPR